MNWMSMREFLRGGYKELKGPTVVSNHGRPMFTVFPHDAKPGDASTAQRAGVVRSDPGHSVS